MAIPIPWFSIRDLALWCALSGTITGALLAFFVYRMTYGWISSGPVRLFLASFVALTPVLGTENTANMVNTIWIFAAVVPWALVALREGRRDTAVRACVAFLAATATPLCVLYVPLAAIWLLIRRTRSARIVAMSLYAGLAVQAVVIYTTSGLQGDKLVRKDATLRDGIGQRVFAAFLLGPKWAARFWIANWRLSALVSTVVVLAIVAVLLPGPPADEPKHSL